MFTRVAQHRRFIALMPGDDGVDKGFAAEQEAIDGVEDAAVHASRDATGTARFVRYDSTPASAPWIQNTGLPSVAPFRWISSG